MVAKPTAKPTEKPIPTPSFKKETVTIKILNGSGTKGKATEVKDILKEKGYVEILTGNADNFDYAKSELQVKPDKKDAAAVFIKDLSDHVKITKTSDLDKKNPADLILIIGADFE